jgi:hypothetical protein
VVHKVRYCTAVTLIETMPRAQRAVQRLGKGTELHRNDSRDA